jgi:tripartite-type tricarboxylate transporter receptor subunit TctC
MINAGWIIKAAAAIIAGLATLADAPASAFPERPITMIVPWAPGGSTDLTGRALARAAEKHFGQPIVILNKPGASTIIGMRELAQAKPDGYTIGTLSSSSYLAPLTGQAAGYDILKDFTYVSYYGDNLIGIAVLKDKPWKSLADLIEDGKKNPEKINYGTGGVNTTQHLMVEALSRRTGAKFTHVPQRGSAGSVPALLGNHVDFISEVSVWAPYLVSGEARLLILNTPKRAAAYPDVPTYAELGFEYLRSVQATIGPAGIPEDIRQKLETGFRKALEDPGFRDVMAKLQMEISDLPGPQVRELVISEIEKAKGVIAYVGAK